MSLFLWRCRIPRNVKNFRDLFLTHFVVVSILMSTLLYMYVSVQNTLINKGSSHNLFPSHSVVGFVTQFCTWLFDFVEVQNTLTNVRFSQLFHQLFRSVKLYQSVREFMAEVKKGGSSWPVVHEIISKCRNEGVHSQQWKYGVEPLTFQIPIGHSNH